MNKEQIRKILKFQNIQRKFPLMRPSLLKKQIQIELEIRIFEKDYFLLKKYIEDFQKLKDWENGKLL